MINPSKEQKEVVDTLIDLLHETNHDRKKCIRSLFTFVVGGYAGTGKTTMLAYLREQISQSFPKLSIAFVTFTGKASSVLESKLNSHGVNTSRDFIGTIHSLIYKPKTRWDKTLKTHVIVGWELKSSSDELYEDLIIIDEGSMVSHEIWRDLLKMDRPIIVVGDHGQLPPVGDKFGFNLMKNANMILTQIHRQALNSPIVKLSQFVRQNGYIPVNRKFSNDVFKLSWRHPICQKIWNNNVVFDENLMVLCAFNATRVSLNKQIREKLDYPHETDMPVPSERLVCLQNDRDRGVMNGQLGSLIWLMPENHSLYRMTIQVDEFPEPIECTVSKQCFGEVSYTNYSKSKFQIKQRKYSIEKGLGNINYFDFGYALSVHKAQGSEWDRVILFEQRTKHWDDEYYARWLYTAITRSRKKLFIISDYWG